MEEESLMIHPFKKPLKSTLTLPGSKSITNRALILGALANGPIVLEGALFSRDTLIMIEALKALGFDVEENQADSKLRIVGLSSRIPNKTASIHVGNAGTAARFLTAFLGLQKGGTYELDGDPQMYDRPIQGLLDALETLGAAKFIFHKKPGHFPFRMTTNGISRNFAQVDASASSQILSALLLVFPSAGADLKLHCPNVRPAYVSVTEATKKGFGIQTAHDDSGTYFIKSEAYKTPETGTYVIEPDLSAASYFLALSLLHGGQLEIQNIPKEPIQGDAQFANILKQHGLIVDSINKNWRVQRKRKLNVNSIHRELNFNLFSDTFLTYAAITPIINETALITGIGHTRLQETDRVAAMAKELKKLGQQVKETESSLEIISDITALKSIAQEARASNTTIKIDTYEDHRFAMSFAILGTYDLLEDGKPWLSIKDPNCCGKTFPDFFKTLELLRNESER